jgi:hypothetical protein
MRNTLLVIVFSLAVLVPGRAFSEASRMDQKLASPVSLEFMDVHLLGITNFISDSWGINVVLDWRVVGLPPTLQPDPAKATFIVVPGEYGPDYVTDGMVRHISVKNIPLREALNALLKPLNLTFVATPSHLWISSPAMLKADAKDKKPSTRSKTKDMAAALTSPINLEFEGIHLEEVLAFMANSWNVNLVLDSRVVLPNGRDNADAPVGSPGYISSGRVHYVNLKNIAFSEALALLLRPMNLTFKVEKGFVWISSHKLINAKPLSAEAANTHSGQGGESS